MITWKTAGRDNLHAHKRHRLMARRGRATTEHAAAEARGEGRGKGEGKGGRRERAGRQFDSN